MREGDLSIVSSTLHLATRTLMQRWDDTASQWNDAAARNFHEQYLVPIEPAALTTLKALGRLAQVIQRAREECADPDHA